MACMADFAVLSLEVYYRPRERVGKGFTHICLSVCVFR